MRSRIYDQITPEELLASVTECQSSIRSHGNDYYDFFALRYSYIRQFAPTFLISFYFHSNHQLDGLLEAIALLRNLDATKKRKVPETTSIKFVSSKWKDYVVNEEGKIVRKYYELCALWQLRGALRSGNVWLKHSRKYANPESYLIPQAQWASLKSEVCQLVQVSESGIHITLRLLTSSIISPSVKSGAVELFLLLTDSDFPSR